jgi:hypothetical protein
LIVATDTNEIETNEIRDYLQRAPKRRSFDGQRMVNNTQARYTWLASIARGVLDEKINRRAGVVFTYQPWKHPVNSAIRRQQRRKAIIAHGYFVNPRSC